MRLRKFMAVLGVTALLALLGLVLLPPAAPVQAQDGAEGEGGDAEAGAVLYAANCAVCHGASGEGRTGASLNRVYGGIEPGAFLSQTISQGIEGTFMPAWGQANGGPLSDGEIADIVAYIESWGTANEPLAPEPRQPEQTIPEVAEVNGDPNAGYTIFQENCVACHGENGEGRTGASLNHVFAGIEPGAFVIQTISRGRSGTLMPPFAQQYGGPLTDQQIQDVAAYVFTLDRAARPEQGEVIGQASGWPLLVVLIGALVLVLALGIAISRGNVPPGDTGEH